MQLKLILLLIQRYVVNNQWNVIERIFLFHQIFFFVCLIQKSKQDTLDTNSIADTGNNTTNDCTLSSKRRSSLQVDGSIIHNDLINCKNNDNQSSQTNSSLTNVSKVQRKMGPGVGSKRNFSKWTECGSSGWAVDKPFSNISESVIAKNVTQTVNI